MDLLSSDIHAALLDLAACDKSDFDAALRHILSIDARILGVDRVSFWSLHRIPHKIVCELGYLTKSDSFESGTELRASDYPHYFQALSEEKVIAAEDAFSDPRTREFTHSYLRPCGIGAMLDVPVWVRNAPAGVLCHEHIGPPRAWTKVEQEFAIAVSQVVATTLEVRERRRAESAERRAEFLSEATAVLTESLNIDAIPARLARLALPYLADWCLIDVVAKSDVRRVARAHVNGDGEAVLAELERCYPPGPITAHPTSRVIRSGQALIADRVSEELLRMLCQDEEHLRLFKRLGTQTMMVLPLRARGRLLGAIAFGASAGRRYGSDDVSLARELARRAAIAIDNAQLYREAQEAIRRRDDFLSVASHELYTPLTSLQLSLQTLHRRGATRENVEHICAFAERQTQRLADLVDELLSVTRIQAGRLHLKIEPVDLREVVDTVADRFTEQMARSRSTLSIEAPAPVIGRWDRSRLDQVMTNLLSNAIKFGRGRPIRVRVTGDEVMARLSVNDQGIGIAAERLPLIFERFERAVSTEVVGGLGLGLHIVKSIVTALGGRIFVESRLDEGSTFTVELPRAGPPASGG